MRYGCLRGLAVGLLLAGSALADGIPIEGTVRAPDGSPSADAVVGFEWQFRGKWVPFQALSVGKDGGFVGELHWTNRPMVLLAMDAAGKNGAMRVLTENDLTGPFELNLRPLQTVKGTLECPDLGPLGTSTVAIDTPEGARIFRLTLKEPKFSVPLPPGKYVLTAAAFDAREFRREIEVPAEGGLDLGALVFEATVIARSWGKEPPAFKATAARGVDAATTPASFKGRWVLVVFWSADSLDCTRALFPRLNALVEKHKERAADFAILALHEPGVATLADMDKRLARVKEGSWMGKDPLFPLMLDASGETWKAFGIEKVPTMVLLDPEGKVVKQGTEQVLDARLRGAK